VLGTLRVGGMATSHDGPRPRRLLGSPAVSASSIFNPCTSGTMGPSFSDRLQVEQIRESLFDLALLAKCERCSRPSRPGGAVGQQEPSVDGVVGSSSLSECLHCVDDVDSCNSPHSRLWRAVCCPAPSTHLQVEGDPTPRLGIGDLYVLGSVQMAGERGAFLLRRRQPGPPSGRSRPPGEHPPSSAHLLCGTPEPWIHQVIPGLHGHHGWSQGDIEAASRAWPIAGPRSWFREVSPPRREGGRKEPGPARRIATPGPANDASKEGRGPVQRGRPVRRTGMGAASAWEPGSGLPLSGPWPTWTSFSEASRWT
jgi:hypothetical protein